MDWKRLEMQLLRLPFERGMDSKFMPNDSRYQYFSTELSSEKIHLPEGLGRIPSCFANDCWDLQEVNIPSTVKSIDRAAFEQCKSLKK